MEVKRLRKAGPKTAHRFHAPGRICAGLLHRHDCIPVLGLLNAKQLLVDALADTAERIETPEEVADNIASAMEYVSPERRFSCTNCGMTPLPYNVALGKLKSPAAGARLARKSL
jgi:5-methyltetrahydropteroyltriglutamate--homocysteine methyltransferase